VLGTKFGVAEDFIQEWDHNPREDGQVALGRPIFQDAFPRRKGL
jgi:hypothetical protein